MSTAGKKALEAAVRRELSTYPKAILVRSLAFVTAQTFFGETLLRHVRTQAIYAALSTVHCMAPKLDELKRRMRLKSNRYNHRRSAIVRKWNAAVGRNNSAVQLLDNLRQTQPGLWAEVIGTLDESGKETIEHEHEQAATA